MLNEITRAFLKENGISIRHFSKCTDIEYSTCSRWLSGSRNINEEQENRVCEYLSKYAMISVGNCKE